MDSVLIPLKAVEPAATIPQLKYWAKQSGIELVVRGRVAHVRPEDADTLRRIFAMVTEGRTPQEAIKALGKSPDHPIISTPPAPASFSPEIGARLEAMERAIMLLVDENRNLRGEVASLRLRIEPPAPIVADPPKPIVIRQVEKPPAQREPSLWEQVSMTFNDMMGFAFGRG